MLLCLSFLSNGGNLCPIYRQLLFNSHNATSNIKFAFTGNDPLAILGLSSGGNLITV